MTKSKRPHTLTDAADLLDVGERQAQRLAARGLLGPTRLPTAAERVRYGLAANTIIVRTLAHAQRYNKARQKLLADRRIAAKAKARRQARAR